MRKNFILFFVPIVFMTANCGSGTGYNDHNTGLKQTENGPVKITFKEYDHNFGKVAEGEKIGYIFTFENIGTGNLIISSVTSSCGCTIPKYDSQPVPPGRNGNIEVIFDTSGRNGMQTKTITVKSNASPPVVLLKISAEVVTSSN